MQIKEAYQRRIKQKLSPSKYKPSQIDHSSVIGSVRTGKVNYKKAQKFFEDSFVRSDVIEAKKQVKQLKDPDYLQLKVKKWNNSVEAPVGFKQEDNHKAKLLKIRLGLLDYKQIKSKPAKVYPGTQTRNSYEGWNVSTYFQNKQKDLSYLYTNANALKNTVNYNSNKLPNYKSLKKRYYETSELQKDQIINSSDIIQQLKSSFLFSNPGSSPQKTHAIAYKMFDQHKRDQLKLSLSSMGTQDSFSSSFQAKLSPTQKMNIKAQFYHNGIWGKTVNTKIQKQDQNSSSNQQQQGCCWSCCLNSNRESKGCNKRIIDKNKMNLISYT